MLRKEKDKTLLTRQQKPRLQLTRLAGPTGYLNLIPTFTAFHTRATLQRAIWPVGTPPRGS